MYPGRNQGLLDGGGLLGKARTGGKYVLHTNHVPYVAKAEAVSRIVGEVYEVDATLAVLDRLEGCPHWYRRERVFFGSPRRPS